MKLGSLFSGGGLGDLGFMAAGMDIAWQVEIDEYCQKILALRFPESEKYRDIKNIKGTAHAKVDILTGGFPCQPFSVAGKQKGKEDNRYLWPEMLRVIKECRPRWVVGENVPGIINMALDTVCSDLEAEGYEVWPIVFPSHALGAWHKRDRLWIVGYSKHDGLSKPEVRRSMYEPSISKEQDEGIKSKRAGLLSENVANSSDARFKRVCEWKNKAIKSFVFGEYWKSEPAVGRVANGITDRVHRLKMLGNGQVPACTYVIGKMIMEIENEQRTKREN